jgi:hypothetical protein
MEIDREVVISYTTRLGVAEGWQGRREITVKRDSMGRPISAA